MEEAPSATTGKKKHRCEKDYMRSRSFMATVQLLCEEATSHGVGHAWNNRYNMLGVFWVIVTGILLGVLWYYVIALIIEFAQRNDKSQTTSLMADKGLQIPSVSLCNRAFYSRRKMRALNISDSMASYLVLKLGDASLIRDDLLGNEEGEKLMDEADAFIGNLLDRLNLTVGELVDAISYDCEEMILMCTVARRTMSGKECCSAMISMATFSGKCYVYFSDHTKQNVQSVEGEFLGVSLYLRSEVDDHPEQFLPLLFLLVLDPAIVDFTQIMKTGLQISLFSNQTHPSLTAVGHGVSLTPKMYTTTEVSLVEVKDVGLKTFVDWDLEDCVPTSAVGYMLDREGFYRTQPNCMFGAIRTCFQLICNCSNYALDIENDALRPCSLKELLPCYALAFQNLDLQSGTDDFMDYVRKSVTETDIYASRRCLNSVTRGCRRPCTRFDYSYTSSQSPINEDIYNSLRQQLNLSDTSELAVSTAFFPNMRYAEIRLWRDSVGNLISSIGGITGVLLGCSIVSFIEFFVAFTLFSAIFVRHCHGGSAHRTDPSEGK
ncbi:sodium channel protein Nach-like [Macrobrachium rosenbergii]|uniref:sodium channel protein Nach-like n=1 Tax=Macrobrachium rosenbergii TaxID=79674 RepID=UPI0034D6868D